MRVLAAGLGLLMMGSPVPAGEMPANTVPLSRMMQELSSRPGFTEAFLAAIPGGKHKAGPGYITPELVHRLREMILGRDWQGLDRFPGWTMGRINPMVRVVGHVAGKNEKVDELATAGGAPAVSPEASRKALVESLDVGAYSLSEGGALTDFRRPSTLAGFNSSDYVSSLGDGVIRGDGPSGLAAEHAESQRLAYTLNRLSANGLDGVPTAKVILNAEDAPGSPEDLIDKLRLTGHSITVTDSRYFANFGHLHYHGQDVMMPFWVDTGWSVPQSGTGSGAAAPRGERPLLVPVSHAELEWHIRGPQINASVSFYFGIDGKAEFRTMDQLDQAWVMKRDAHIFTGKDAVEVTRLTGAIVRTYARLHVVHPAIPFGGYYAFGVCQDVVAAVEMKMTGKTTLFPNTADAAFFTDVRDAEINELIKRLPKDRDGRAPGLERLFGSLPVGDSDAELAGVGIPGLGGDLVAMHDAWTRGEAERLGERRRTRNRFYAAGVALMLCVVGMVWWQRRKLEV